MASADIAASWGLVSFCGFRFVLFWETAVKSLRNPREKHHPPRHPPAHCFCRPTAGAFTPISSPRPGTLGPWKPQPGSQGEGGQRAGRCPGRERQQGTRRPQVVCPGTGQGVGGVELFLRVCVCLQARMSCTQTILNRDPAKPRIVAIYYVMQ